MSLCTLLPGKLPHLLLSVATLAPSTTTDLVKRVEARHGKQKVATFTIHAALQRLTKAGFLEYVGIAPGPGGPKQYVLTRKGEKELDLQWFEREENEAGRAA